MLPTAKSLWITFGLMISILWVSMLLALLIILLPSSVASKIAPLKTVHKRLRKGARHCLRMSTQGPFYRFLVWSGRKLSVGRLSSRCAQPSKLRPCASGRSEVLVTFTPELPAWNLFHEEDYVLAWRRSLEGPGGQAPQWHEKAYSRSDDCEELGGGRLRVFLAGLPEFAGLTLRVCAESPHGRGPWSQEAQVETLARPTDAGGFRGPLGPAAAGGGHASYSWEQSQNEVSFKVPIGDAKAKDLRFKSFPTRLEILRVGADGATGDLLVGPLSKRIRSDDTTWCIAESEAEGRHIDAQLVKAEALAKWPCLIEAGGHPRVDTRDISFFVGKDGLGGMTDLSSLDLYE